MTQSVRAYLALALGLMGLAFSGIFVVWAHAPGAVTGFYRMGIATLVWALPFARQWRNDNKPTDWREVGLAVLGGLFFASDLIFWNTGVLISGATTPTLMSNTAPLWVGLGAMFFFREKLGRMFWVGLLIALTGSAIVLGQDALKNVGLGSLYGLLSGVFYGGFFIVTQRSRQKLDTLISFWWGVFGATIFLGLTAVLLGQPFTGYSSFTYLNFLAIGLIVQVFGQFAISYALGHLPASIISPTLLGQPILTALLAIPFLGESFNRYQVLGGTAVLVGIYIVHTSRQSKPSTSS